ncbi:unnamed protein product, partial [Clonostachys chloroleuca]
RHSKHVHEVALDVRQFFGIGESYRDFHGSSNSARPRHGSQQNAVDISMLSNVLQVDTESHVALVEPNVPMDRLVEATLIYGLVPPVVMEFPGITAGGGFSTGESSSFRHGFFNDTVNSLDMILGIGDIVRESRQDATGPLSRRGRGGWHPWYLRLVKARKLVKTTYQKVTGVSDAVAGAQSQTETPDVDYADAIMFSKEHSVIITGQLTDTMPAGGTLPTFSNAHDPWFYMHVSDKTRDLAPAATIVEYIPLELAFGLADKAATSKSSHSSSSSVGCLTITLTPKHSIMPFMQMRLVGEEKASSGTTSMSRPMLNIGIWGFGDLGPRDYKTLVAKKKKKKKKKNRQLESTLKALGGRKGLYAHTYYTEDQFWADPHGKVLSTTLPTIYDKAKVEPQAGGKNPNQWSKSWLSTWPIGGLYGMILATLSGDIGVHRRATWRFKED